MAKPENDKQTAKISAASVSTSFLNHLTHTVGRPLEFSTPQEQYRALAHTVRDLVMENWSTTVQGYKKPDLRVVAYMSAECLLGPHLLNDLQALGITKDCDEAMHSLDLDLSALAAQEPEPGLGNGGLGRLAACFMDSLSTLNVTAIGYGLRYEFGMFHQDIRDGWQAERADTWLQYGTLGRSLLLMLERWPLPLFQKLLPRHLEIIFEINRRFLDEMRERFPNDDEKMRRMSLIGEEGKCSVRMANLAVVGSKAVNAVAELHTELLERETLHHFYVAFPKRFSNKTNGVTPRRWLMLSNPSLCGLINEAIGTKWHTDLYELHALEPLADDAGFLGKWRATQEATKAQLANYVRSTAGIVVDPTSMFYAQVKRIHEYKWQHLNALHILSLYCQLKANPSLAMTPRTFLFGGKAAPSYTMAKLIIKLINSVADVINNDPDVQGRLKVIFLPDYNVSLGQRVYPAADLAEQISTAGKEASGTGCMKFQMNGAVTIGTLDGANIEIREEVGEENFLLFGLTTPEVEALQLRGYRPLDFYERVPLLREVIDGLQDSRFSKGDKSLFSPARVGAARS